jgi:hypothetical protein
MEKSACMVLFSIYWIISDCLMNEICVGQFGHKHAFRIKCCEFSRRYLAYGLTICDFSYLQKVINILWCA